jgi:hypothetical protein
MRPLFPPWTNTVSRLMAVAILAMPALAVAGLMLYVRTPFSTGALRPVEQLVQFDHRHHVRDEGIDCRYCHSTVETGPYAGVPATEVCMGCHAQIWNRSPQLQEVRARYFSDRPIPWKRVHDLPDFVYFNHSIHVNKGVGCATCHGRVDQMASVQQVSPLTMGWCLDCHRAPERHLRPLEQITSMTWKPARDPAREGARLALAYGVHTRTSCTTCHR